MLFSDQVSILSTWFKNWNECEQTVALFSLLKRVKKHQAKFLLRCLEHLLRDCSELQPVERQANDAGFIGKLMSDPVQEEVITTLLVHLPLLRPGNNEAKIKYLELLPRVLAFAVERSEYLQESRQLLSYSLIHPAFDNDERSSLTQWMEHLDDRIPDVPPESNGGGDQQNESDLNHNKLYKNDSDIQRNDGYPNISSPTPTWQSPDNTQLSERYTPQSLSPTKTQDTDTGSRHGSLPRHLEDNATPPEYDFNPWLKSLRLHKYKDLFASMSYSEMLQLTEETLVKKNVTKGARDKILLNVRKLHERFEKLQALEKEIPGGGSLKNALGDLKTMIHTPIKPFEPPTPNDLSSAVGTEPRQNLAPGPAEIQPGDIPGQFTKVLGKACTQLLISKPDKDNIVTYMQLLERCIQHPAFTEQQRKRLLSWKSQVNKMYRSLPRNQMASSQRNAAGSNYGNRKVTNRSMPSIGARMASPIASPPLRTSNPHSLFANQPTKMWTYGAGFGGSNTQPKPHTTHPPISAARKTASLDPSLVHQLYGPNLLDMGRGDFAPTSPDSDISRLDSLCHSVAEHALAVTDFQEHK